MQIVRSAWPWLMGGAALAAANGWLVAYDVNQFDESWTLQVVHRIADGDALYRDVWLGTTPLSIYLLHGVTRVVGEQIVVVKALSALLAAGSALVLARIALQAGVTRFGAVVIVLLTVPLAPAVPVSLYTPLAVIFFLACESIALGAVARPGLGRAALAGGTAGLAFAAKPNVGALAMLALAATFVLAEPVHAGLRRVATAATVFGGVALATVAAMIATGGLRKTLDALGLGKGEYLERGSIHYHEMLLDHLEKLTRPQTWLDQLAGRDRDLVVATPKVLLPVAAAALLAAAWVAWAKRRAGREGLDPRLVAVTAFAAAGFLAAFPRYDTIHLAWTAGPMLVACGVALTFLPRPPLPGVRLAGAVVAGAWALFVLTGPLDDWRGSPVRLGLPHFDGVWTSEETRADASAALSRLQDALPHRRVFILAPFASFYYLAAGLDNPTRYDFPAATLIGEAEADEIVEQVTEGTIPAVCLMEGVRDRDRDRDGLLPPRELERRLQLALRPGPDVGPCRLWLPKATPS